MTIDKAKLKALAETGAASGNWLECQATDVLALLAEIEQLREAHEQVCTNYSRVSFVAEERSKERDQLKAASIVPGTMQCAKCKFHRVSKVLNMAAGTVGMAESKPEPCPNGCGPLWPITWEQEAHELGRTLENMHDQIQQLKAENEALRKDAERYRWLRDKQTFIWLIQDWFPSDAAFTDVDGEISTAMAKEASHG